MLTAGIALGAATGCYDEKYLDDTNLPIEDVYIVMEDKGNKVVHKGNYLPILSEPFDGYGKAGTGLLSLQFDCGRKLLTNADCYIYENKPTKDIDYDTVCEDCFSLEKSL